MQALTKRPERLVAALTVAGFSAQQWQEGRLSNVDARGRITALTVCEPGKDAPPSVSTIPSPSSVRKALAKTLGYPLPLPRQLVPKDPAFSDNALKRGLKQRQQDEDELRSLIEEVRASQGEQDKLHELFVKMTTYAYGEGVTPQMREDFLVVSEICTRVDSWTSWHKIM
jgi:hypothetical protein